MGKKAKKAPREDAETPKGDEEEAEGGGELDLGDDGDALEFKVSDKYAKRYNERKDKEELSRAARILADEEDGDHGTDSETEPEDESGELLTERVEGKIFETLSRIKAKDPSIYDKSTVFFKDDDFEGPGGASSSSAPKKAMTYKDFVRDTLLKDGAAVFTREEEEMAAGTGKKRRKGATPKQEEEELRRSIIAAAVSGEAGGEGGGDDDDDLFTLKEKSAEELQREKESSEEFERKAARERKSMTGDDYMSRYFDGADLDENEKFLRDYVVNQAWKETISMQPKAEEDEDDDESHLDEQDEFEKEYNFRFEMEDGKQIQGHKRFLEGSVREKNDKRKRQRHERKERKDAEKIRRTEELKRLKNLKKQEIMRRLKQLQEVTGNEEIPLGAQVLDTDFDPEEHDKTMASAFNEDYDAAEEALDEEAIVKPPPGLDELDVSAAAAEVLQRTRGAGAAKRRQPKSAEAEEGGEEWDEGDGADGGHQGAVDPEEWWMCDECQLGIPGGKKRFDCTVCENYTLCVKCFRVRRHPHKFVRRRVPDSCMPPEDLKGVQPNREELDKVLDEYFQMDYEDIIGGDLPTRFKYTKVAPNDCGLTVEQILEKSDKELNRVVPLKKLRTYRTDDNKTRKEAAWKWKHQAKLAKQVDDAVARGGAAKPAEGANGLSASRLAAYNLESDRRYGGGAAGKKAKRKGKG